MKRIAMLCLVIAAAFAVTGCGDSKKEKCEKLAAHMEAIAEKDGGGNSSRANDYQMCMDDFSDSEIDCMLKATSTSGILGCAK